MTPDESVEELIGLVADEQLLAEDLALLPAAVGHPQSLVQSPTRGRLVGLGATMTGLTLIGGLALVILGGIDFLAGGGTLAIIALVLGVVLVATHWGWVHVAEVTADSIEGRQNAGVLDARRRWLEAIAPFTRYEVTTHAGDDGTITIERVRYRPVRSTEGHFRFSHVVELSERHSGDQPAAVVTERAELLRRQAAADTEREREQFEAAADVFERSTLAGDDDREQQAARAAASRALSEQINSNLRDPPLIE
ncbi:MAG: hypothetical protein ACR2NR_23320 [Solirubrobacteraceae bacterium]